MSNIREFLIPPQEDASVEDNACKPCLLEFGGLQSEITVGTTPVEVMVGFSKLPLRRCVTVRPVSGPVFWGYNNTVTVASGTPIFKKELTIFSASDTCPIWLVASTNTTVRITEGG